MQTVTESLVNDFECHPIGTGAELARLSDQVRALADALQTMLNDPEIAADRAMTLLAEIGQ